MAKGLITRAYLEDTADAIRVLRGESDTYTPDEFGEKIIDAIPTEEVTGDIVSVTDAAAYPAEGLEFAIEPVQDLHGYSSPWPAGGGKNLCPDKKYQTTPTSVYIGQDNDTDFPLHLEAGTTYTLSYNFSAALPVYIRLSSSAGGTLVGESNPISFTVSTNGNYRIALARNSGAVPVSDVTNIQFEEGSTATSYAPYSNICPISGWTGLNGERTGKNVWDEEWETGAISNLNGENYALAERVRSKNYISVKPNTSYYFCFPTSYSSIGVACYDKNKTYLGQSVGWLIINNNTAYTLPNNCYYIKFVVVKTDETYNHDISINYPATDTEYHAYQGHSIPITFPTEAGTVYGGKAKPLLGKLAIGMAEVDLGTLDWVYYANATPPQFRASLNPAPKNIPANKKSLTYCSEYPIVSHSQLADKTAAIFYASKNGINICDLRYNNEEDFKAAMQGVQLVYELAKPIEYDLTPQEVQMLLGENNVWCDTGDTTLEYKVDLGRYIEKLKAAQATPQLSLSRQAVHLDEAGDVEPISVEERTDETPTADTTEDDALSR